MKDGTKPLVLFISTYPPRECGIATFTQDIVREMKKNNRITPKVVAISNTPTQYGDDVLFDFKQDEKRDYTVAAHRINASGASLVMVEHEYGIFGGEDGIYLLELLRHLQVPYMVTCHTVLPNPSPTQQEVLRQICLGSTGVVVMSKLSRRMLGEVYGVVDKTVFVMHHGVPQFTRQNREQVKQEEGLGSNIVVSTFGFLGPGKGLEYGIEATALVAQKHPEIRYLVLGQTHPVIKRQNGEEYREKLLYLTRKLGVEDNILFVDKYLYKPDILHYLALTDIYMTPYLGKEQAVSGTLAYAIGYGRVVVSTPYLYAREMLSEGRGLLADFENAQDLANNMNVLIENPDKKRKMEENTLRLGETMVWPKVVAQYEAAFMQAMQGHLREKVS